MGSIHFSEQEVKALGEFIINSIQIFLRELTFIVVQKQFLDAASVEDDKIEAEDLKTIKKVGEIAASMTGEVFLIDGLPRRKIGAIA